MSVWAGFCMQDVNVLINRASAASNTQACCTVFMTATGAAAAMAN
jgi:hypothetical protein